MTSGTSSFSRTFCRASLILLQAVVLAPATLANPQGGRVAAGSASIDRTSASRLDVNQHSDRAVIDWRSFDINADEHTSFQQPSSSSVALNRVQGSGSSLIDGRLTANGQVFLVNQNGVLFGKNARVDVAGLVATTADINNDDFMNGHYRFDEASVNPDAQVVNKGQIQVQDGGAVVLAAPRVSNEGLIAARLGNVALAGAKTFTLDFHGDGLLQFDAGSEVTEPPSDWQSESDALVSNSGTIVADGGIVAMSARAADGVVDRVINMDGVIQARALDVKGGTIILSGGDYGAVDVSGTLDVAGLEPGQRGGEVKVLGEKVNLLDGAYIDASAESSGGEVLVGGNYKGQGPEPNAKQTFVDEGATIKADAITRGDGGKIIVWADEAASIHGTLSARGGAVSGDGGFIETSSKKMLVVSSAVDAGASNGSGGTWLIDPTDFTICAVCDDITGSQMSVDTLNDSLNTGTDVNIETSDAGTEQGNITQEAGATITKTDGADATLTLLAHNDIILNDDITSTSGSLNLTLDADSDNIGGGALTLNSSYSTNGGDFLVDGDTFLGSDSSVSTGGGGITFDGLIDSDTDGGDPAALTLDAGRVRGGAIGLLGDVGSISPLGGLTATGGTIGLQDVTTTGDQSYTGALTLNSSYITDGGNFTVVGNTLLGSDSSVSTGGGRIDFNGLIDSAVDEGDPAVLTLNAVAGAIALFGDVGSISPLGGLTATGGTIGLQDVTTTGDQSYTGALRLNSSYITDGGEFLVFGNTFLESDTSVSTGGGGITFNGLIDSAVVEGDPAVLTLNAVTGAIALLGNVGSISPLGGLTATGGTISLQDVTTTGAQSYTGAVTFNSDYITNGGNFLVNGNTLLESDSSVSTGGGGITFNGLIDSAVDEGDPAVLTLDAVAGAIALLGDVGSISPLGGLTATGGTISLQDVTTIGDQSYTGAVTFNSDYITNGGDFLVDGNTLLRSDTSVSTLGGDITFDGSIDSAIVEGGPAGLTLDAGGEGISGNILFGGDVGTAIRLGPVTIDSAGDITIGGRFIAGDTSFTYSGNATSPVGSLDLTSLFLSPTAQGANVFGTVGGASGEDAALAVQGPSDDPDFTINNCVIGVACAPPPPPPPVVPPPVVPEPGVPQPPAPAEPVPPQIQGSLFGTTPSRPEVRSLWAEYKRRPPSEDPTEPQYSNFGNEELWDEEGEPEEE